MIQLEVTDAVFVDVEEETIRINIDAGDVAVAIAITAEVGEKFVVALLRATTEARKAEERRR